MTRDEWLRSEDPQAMLTWLRDADRVQSDRKLRLFACACVRQVWGLLADTRSRAAVEAAERYADGEATSRELAVARAAAGGAALVAAWDAARAAAGDAALVAAKKLQAILLRDIVGDPFAAARWRGKTVEEMRAEGWADPRPYLPPLVSGMAQRIYDERDFAALPVMADALEDAGCGDAALLAHLRLPGQHVRGCWALDLILGKE